MRLPATRHLLALSAAAAALAAAAPALAQTADSYEYAQPAPDGTVIYRSTEVVQGTPVPHAAAAQALPAPPPLPPVPPMPPLVEHRHHMAVPPPPPPPGPPEYVGPMSGGYAPVATYTGAYPGYAPALPPQFDRDRWLDDCRVRVRGVDRRERGGVIGGLLGAITGGVIGNRAWDSKRTAGTLLGAGVGGLAGLAIGSAIGAADDRRHDDDCAFYLDRYLSSYGGPQPYAGYGYAGYGYGGYALVPVLVAVPQRQVIRETVTEEWIDTPVRSRSVPPRRHHPAAPRTKYIKGN